MNTQNLVKTNYVGRSVNDLDYQKHVQKIQQIKLKRENYHKNIEQYNNISHKLQKARQISRQFKNRQSQIRRTQSDYKMVRAIKNMPSMIKLSQDSQRKTPIKPKGAYQSQKQVKSIKNYMINNQNKKLERAIKQNQIDLKEYKKKIVTQIGQYVKLRQHMQRFKQKKQPTHLQQIKTQRSKTSSKTTNSADFRQFLAKSIKQTKNKINQRRFQTELVDYND